MIQSVEKAVTWTKCMVALRRHSAQSGTPELVDFCMSQPIAPLQIKSELVGMAEELASLKPKRAMEIGTHLGGTLFLLCRLADPAAQVISVDYHRGRFGGARKFVYNSFLREQQRLHVITGDSHSEATHASITSKLGSAKLDFLFIDGDHSYDGVKRDFEMYSPLVRPGGLVAFHDIVAHPLEKECHVKEFWDEVKQSYRHKEFIDSTQQQWAGIGLLYV